MPASATVLRHGAPFRLTTDHLSFSETVAEWCSRATRRLAPESTYGLQPRYCQLPATPPWPILDAGTRNGDQPHKRGRLRTVRAWLAETDTAPVEEHLLVCEECWERLAT